LRVVDRGTCLLAESFLHRTGGRLAKLQPAHLHNRWIGERPFISGRLDGLVFVPHRYERPFIGHRAKLVFAIDDPHGVARIDMPAIGQLGAPEFLETHRGHAVLADGPQHRCRIEFQHWSARAIIGKNGQRCRACRRHVSRREREHDDNQAFHHADPPTKTHLTRGASNRSLHALPCSAFRNC
jgi:hypothetical protein